MLPVGEQNLGTVRKRDGDHSKAHRVRRYVSTVHSCHVNEAAFSSTEDRLAQPVRLFRSEVAIQSFVPLSRLRLLGPRNSDIEIRSHVLNASVCPCGA